MCYVELRITHIRLSLWSAVWGFGLEPDEHDVVTSADEFKENCADWDEFPGQVGAISWEIEIGIEAALRKAPGKAERLLPYQKWYFHQVGDLNVWLRVFEWDELPESYRDEGEREIFDKGYVLAKHFSRRRGAEGETAHVAREMLTSGRYIVLSGQSARLDLMGLGVGPEDLDLPL